MPSIFFVVGVALAGVAAAAAKLAPVVEHPHDLHTEGADNNVPVGTQHGAPFSASKLITLRNLANPWLQKWPDFPKPATPCGSPFVDPMLLQLLTHYARYLPFGLGPYGFYGSTGYPTAKPPGIFRSSEKKDSR